MPARVAKVMRSFFSQHCLRTVITIVTGGTLAFSLSGCGATAAQKQVEAITSVGQLASNEWQACQTQVSQDVAFDSLRQKLQLVSTERVSLEQRADSSKPNPDDLRNLLIWNRRVQGCRTSLLSASNRSFPFLRDALDQGFAAMDDVYVELEKISITGGEANTRLVHVEADNKIRLSNALHPWARAMDAKHQAELANRQAIWNGVAQGVVSGLLVAADAYVNTGPITTTCLDLRAGVSCTTQTRW